MNLPHKNTTELLHSLRADIKRGAFKVTTRKEGYRRTRENTNRTRVYNAKRNYGLTKETLFKMYRYQSDKCWACLTFEADLKRKLHVDHCHTTGRVRGLLCPSCNYALKHVNDSIEVLERLIEYLHNPPAIAAGVEAYGRKRNPVLSKSEPDKKLPTPS